jgi:predicted dehydrogenase
MSRIGVGIIGLSAGGGWAARAHVPALRALADRFALVGLCASSPAAAAAAASSHDVPFHTSDPNELASHPEVDLVVVAVKVPEHAGLVRAAIAAGKAVFCEWPLARSLAEAKALAALAEAKRVPAFIGLQGRSTPAIGKLRELIAAGYCGEILSQNIVAAVGMPWDGTTDSKRAYLNDRASGGTMLSIPVGHFLDTLTWLFGDLEVAASTLAIRRPNVTMRETGGLIETDVADQVAIAGRLESGGLVSIHYRGGLGPFGNFRWEINGTEGDLLVTGGDGHSQYGLFEISGARRGEAPGRISSEHPAALAGTGAEGVACAYARLHDDLVNGRSDSPSFSDAVRLHALLERIERR